MITLNIFPKEKHLISPYLYMQFMEPLGVCDTSVDAAWDFVEERWHEPLIEKVRELAPTMVRFGGCFASYYHWKEAVGRYCDRVPMINYCWGGIHANHVGTHEVIDFCRRVDAEQKLHCVCCHSSLVSRVGHIEGQMAKRHRNILLSRPFRRGIKHRKTGIVVRRKRLK